MWRRAQGTGISFCGSPTVEVGKEFFYRGIIFVEGLGKGVSLSMGAL